MGAWTLGLVLFTTPQPVANYESVWIDAARFPSLEQTIKAVELADKYIERLDTEMVCCRSYDQERKQCLKRIWQRVLDRRHIYVLLWNVKESLEKADDSYVKQKGNREWMVQKAFYEMQDLRRALGERDFWEGRLPFPIPRELCLSVDAN